MLRLNDLRDKPYSSKKVKRVGRGKSGKRPGHGGKGQTARSGVALGNFQGGQTPLERRLPKQRTFFHGKDDVATVSLRTIERLITNGNLNAEMLIDFSILREIGAIRKAKKFRVVGSCSMKLNIEASGASSGAMESVKNFSGEIRLIQ